VVVTITSNSVFKEKILAAAFQYLKGTYRKDGKGLFTRVYSDRTRGNSSKLKGSRFTLDTRKKFFTMKVVKHCPEKLWMPPP